MAFLTTILGIFLSLIVTTQTNPLLETSYKESHGFLKEANQISLNSYLRLPTVKGKQDNQPAKSAKIAKNQSKKIVQHTNQFNPELPFKTSSVWHNNNLNLSSFTIKNSQFIAKPGNTWFVYGLFGPIKAILQANNVKYPAWENRHNGIDFTARYGLPVTAAEEGTVAYTGPFQGNTVIIKHSSGYQTTYGHLSTVNVTAGQRVEKGQFIGKVGNSGTLNTHLHFEVDQWRGPEPYGSERGNVCYAINPLKFISLSGAIVPDCNANTFYSGSQNPYSQPDFAWNNPLRL